MRVCLWAGLAAVGLGCRSATSTSQGHAQPLASAPAKNGEPQPPLKGEQVEVPASTFNAGTVPGDYPRDPALEPRLTQVTLGAFRVDRLPFPNDPSQPVALAPTQTEAASRCASQGKRLCTELEWELLCKGPQSLPFATGMQWRPECAEPAALCDSPLKVLGLGRTLEWTASSYSQGKEADSIVLRGAASAAPSHERRCAHRTVIAATAQRDDVGFRCCDGAPNAAKVPTSNLGTPFRPVALPIKSLSAILAKDPNTAILEDPSYFVEPEATRTVLSRGDGDTQGFSFTVLPLLWNPDLGTELVIAVGRAKNKLSFVVVLLVVADNEYRVTASMILKDEPGPIALAYSNDIRPRLHFSGCWGCPGETGKILYRKPDAAVITQP